MAEEGGCIHSGSLPELRQLRVSVISDLDIQPAAPRTHRRYTVRPTAVPIRAALNAVETIEPASVRRRLAGGKSTSISITIPKGMNESRLKGESEEGRVRPWIKNGTSRACVTCASQNTKTTWSVRARVGLAKQVTRHASAADTHLQTFLRFLVRALRAPYICILRGYRDSHR